MFPTTHAYDGVQGKPGRPANQGAWSSCINCSGWQAQLLDTDFCRPLCVRLYLQTFAVVCLCNLRGKSSEDDWASVRSKRNSTAHVHCMHQPAMTGMAGHGTAEMLCHSKRGGSLPEIRAAALKGNSIVPLQSSAPITQAVEDGVVQLMAI